MVVALALVQALGRWVNSLMFLAFPGVSTQVQNSLSLALGGHQCRQNWTWVVQASAFATVTGTFWFHWEFCIDCVFSPKDSLHIASHKEVCVSVSEC